MGKQSNAKKQRQVLKSLTPTQFLHDSRRTYISEWRQSSSCHSALGHYQWMASLLGAFDCGFDIGSGDGSGLLELSKHGRAIISIDENASQTQIARERLSKDGVQVHYLQREMIDDLMDVPLYAIQYCGIPVKPSSLPLRGVYLLDGDCTPDADLGLREWLRGVGPFDVVTCWLMGTHRARQRSWTYRHFEPDNPHMYRKYIHNQVYDLANEILKPGGLLQVVDRGPGPVEKMKDSAYREWQEQAKTTILTLKAIDAIEYETVKDGIRLVASDGRTMPPKLSLCSVISQKPA